MSDNREYAKNVMKGFANIYTYIRYIWRGKFSQKHNYKYMAK